MQWIDNVLPCRTIHSACNRNKVLVLETIGSIQNFIRAVEKIQGLEWFGEYELDDIPPDYGFENEKNAKTPLKGRLFLIMTDQRATEPDAEPVRILGARARGADSRTGWPP